MRMRKQGLRNLGMAREPEPQQLEPNHSVQEVQSVQEVPQFDAPPAKVPDVEASTFVMEARRRLAALEGQNAYARLGVTSNASQEQIKKAYIAAAKKYHPDRAAATPGLGGILPELQALFSALKEAHDQIGPPAAQNHGSDGLAQLCRSDQSGSGPGAGAKITRIQPAGGVLV